MNIWNRLFGGGAKSAATQANKVGLQQFEQYRRTRDPEDLERTIEVCEQAIQQCQPGDPSLPVYLSHLGVGLALRYERTGNLADLERALEADEQAVKEPQPGDPDLPGRLSNLGGHRVLRYDRTGDLADLERAVEVCERALEQSQPGKSYLPPVLMTLGSALYRRFDRTRDPADLERAIEVIEQAVEEARPDDPGLPNGLSGLGGVHMKRYEQTGNLADLERAIEVTEQAVEQSQPGDPSLRDRLTNLSGVFMRRYERTGDLADVERAIGANEQAVEQSRPDDPGLPSLLGNLGACLVSRYERTKDLAALERAIQVDEQAVEQSQPSDPILPHRLHNLGKALAHRYFRTEDLADLDKTIEVLEQAWSLWQTTFAASPVTYKIGQQRLSVRLSSQLTSAHLMRAQASPAKASAARRRALEVAEGSKSRILTELIGRAELPAPPSIDLQLVEREQHLLAELTALDNTALAAQGAPTTSTEVRRLMPLQQRQQRLQELEDLWTQMTRAGHEAADYVALRRGKPPTWQDIAHLAAELGSETALISLFVSAENRTLLFIVRAGWEEPVVVEGDFGGSARIDTLQRLFREVHTSRGSTRRGETWHRPLVGLLEKARSYLDGVTRVVLVPYFQWHLIPWSVVAERAGWRDPKRQPVSLVTLPALGLLRQLRNHPSHRVPALGLLRRLRNRPSHGDGSVLVVGNPRGDLKYAEEEAHEVARTLRTKPLLGAQATKAEVISRLSDATVVHLATHAKFNAGSPLDSGVLLANRDVLSAREVMNQRLHTDLLVLSACQTGVAGSLGGDELTGLAQAFLQAGARSLIVSLWNVEDSSTASLMRAFYSAYRGGADKAQALSQAMTHVREHEEWQHPFYWGAFVLMGNW